VSGLDSEAVDLVMRANPKRYLRYAQTQAAYKQWCLEHQLDPMDPTGANIVNYLTDGHNWRSWSSQTLENYRLAILDMFPNRAEIIASFAHKSFFQAIHDQSIRADLSRPVDIEPILAHFRTLGPNASLSINNLTAKLCWLLGVCGFLRPSDIERIDLNSSDWTSNPNELVLQVVAPKEKRLGQRIRRTVHIHAHPDNLLCPVAAFHAYHSRFAHRPCVFPHPVLPHLSIAYLIRDVRDPFKPIKAERIGKHINSIMELLPMSPGMRKLKARALGSTRALRQGASVNDVVSHGGWSTKDIFNNFYRLSSETNTDFTSLTLASSHEHWKKSIYYYIESLESQSLDPRPDV
jgi:hypothetical protein